MKDKQQQTNQSENTLTEIFKYEVEAGVSEYHVMIHATRPEATYEEQLNAVVDTYCQLRESELQGAVAIFKRYFLSDAARMFGLCTLRGRAAAVERYKDRTVGLSAERCGNTGTS